MCPTRTSLVLTPLAFAVFATTALAQQVPSIQSGVTFQWAANQPNNSSAAEITSITLDGSVFDLFVVPTTY